MADPCAKFEVSTVSRCGDFIHGVSKFKTCQLTLITPLLGNVFFILRVGLAVISLCTKFEVSRFNRYTSGVHITSLNHHTLAR